MDKYSEKKPTIVVLAAGMASRYGGLKQIDPFGPSGETIIDYSIYDAIRAGFKKVVFIIRKNIEEEFKEVFIEKLSNYIEVDYAFQEIDMVPEGVEVPADRTKPWGTGHAVLLARNKVNDPFAVINGDDFYGASAFQLLYDYLFNLNQDELHACMIAYQLKNTLSDHGYVSRGVCSMEEDRTLRNITERTHINRGADGSIYYEENDQQFPLSGEELVSMNLLGFTPPFFKVLSSGYEEFMVKKSNEPGSEYFLPTAVAKLIEDHHVKIPVIETSEMTYGVTYKQDKPVVKERIKQMVEEGLYPGRLWSK